MALGLIALSLTFLGGYGGMVSLAQMSIAWVLRHKAMTSAPIGARHLAQLEQNIAALQNLKFEEEELGRIEAILAS